MYETNTVIHHVTLLKRKFVEKLFEFVLVVGLSLFTWIWRERMNRVAQSSRHFSQENEKKDGGSLLVIPKRTGL